MKKDILVVDDSLEILEGIKMILSIEGYNVRAMSEGEKILDEINNKRPALILIDYMMPGLSGGDIVKKLRRDHKNSSIPVIMFSASQELERVALNAGANDFIAKPFDLEELVEKIEKNIN